MDTDPNTSQPVEQPISTVIQSAPAVRLPESVKEISSSSNLEERLQNWGSD
jgi:hypothetical protein